MAGEFARHSAIATVPSLGYALAISNATVTLDEGWSPFIQATLTCAAPDAATTELFDPRDGIRVTLELRQDFGDYWKMGEINSVYAGKTMGEMNALFAGQTFQQFTASHVHTWNTTGISVPTSATFDLSLRSRAINHATGEMTVTLASDESILAANTLVETTPTNWGVPSVRGTVSQTLSRIGATLEPGDADATIAEEDADSLIWNPGVNAWEYLSVLTQKANLRLYCDDQRKWRLVSALSTVPGLVTLSAENDVTLASDTISLEDQADWYDAVVIKYSWNVTTTDTTDPENPKDVTVAKVAYDVAGNDHPVRALYIEYNDRPYPGPGAAEGVLRRSGGRGRVLDVTATSSYTAIPGKAVTISLPDIEAQTGFVAAVTWNFPDDTMSIKSRGLIDTPETAWIFDPEGISWADVPAGTDWTEDI